MAQEVTASQCETAWAQILTHAATPRHFLLRFYSLISVNWQRKIIQLQADGQFPF